MIREYKNVVKKRLKIIKHTNVIILQNQSQSQFHSQKSTFSISTENDKSEKQQCSCEIIHDWKNCEHIIKSARSSNWKCNQQKRKWLKDATLKSRKRFFSIKKIIDIKILNDIKTKDYYKKSNNDNNDKKFNNEKTAENDI